jgi:hypothetical protein
VPIRFTGHSVTRLPWIGCEAGTKIDASTADMAKQRSRMPGFRNMRDLKKRCDNFGRGKAIKDGVEGFVVLSPQGDIMPEGD